MEEAFKRLTEMLSGEAKEDVLNRDEAVKTAASSRKQIAKIVKRIVSEDAKVEAEKDTKQEGETGGRRVRRKVTSHSTQDQKTKDTTHDYESRGSSSQYEVATRMVDDLMNVVDIAVFEGEGSQDES